MEKAKKKKVNKLIFCLIMGLNYLVASTLYFNFFYRIFDSNPGNGAIIWIPYYQVFAFLWMILPVYFFCICFEHLMLGEEKKVKRKSKNLFWMCYAFSVLFLMMFTGKILENYEDILQDTQDNFGGAIFSLPSYSQKKGNKVTIHKAVREKGIKRASWIRCRNSEITETGFQLGDYQGDMIYEIGLDYCIIFDWDKEEIVLMKTTEELEEQGLKELSKLIDIEQLPQKDVSADGGSFSVYLGEDTPEGISSRIRARIYPRDNEFYFEFDKDFLEHEYFQAMKPKE